MQEDKNLKKLLHEYAFEETSSTFNDAVMQRINTTISVQKKPLLNVFVLNLLKIVFLLCSILLVAYFIFSSFNKAPFLLAINFNDTVYRQLFSFLAVFWIVMLINYGVMFKKQNAFSLNNDV